jgi:hypothetical protein
MKIWAYKDSILLTPWIMVDTLSGLRCHNSAPINYLINPGGGDTL